MKKKRNRAATIAIAAFVIFAAIYGFSGTGTTRKEKIESQFSLVNGEHKMLTEYVKSKMQDPGSYENLETNYSDVDTAIIVNQTYTGKNEFGGRVKGFVKAIVDDEGNIKSIIETR